MKRFEASVPRAMYWSNKVGGTSNCPSCGSKLTPEHHTYVMAIRQCKETETKLVGNKCGYFCENCPSVVLDHGGFSDFVSIALPQESNTAEFLVMGIVNLAAIPESKMDIPLGHNENPIPLIEFTNLPTNSPRSNRKTNRRSGKLPAKRRRRRK